MIRPNAELIPEDIIQRVEKMSSALMCDAAKFLGKFIANDGCLGAECKPLDSKMRVVGTAMTVQTSGGSIYPIQAAIKYAKEGYVMVVDGGGCVDRCYCGDIIFAVLKAVGFKGLVIDGYTRDTEGARELGFPVFSTGVTPRSPLREKCGNVNVPITCCGVEVNPGDLVVADYDGVIIIPRDRIMPILEQAEEKIVFEENRRKMIADYVEAKENGKPLPEIVPKWALDILETEDDVASFEK